MSAVALNASIGPLPSSLEPSRDPGRQPSGAFSFSSILKGIDQQDGPSNGGGAPAGVVESAEDAGASQVGMAEESTGADLTAASEPFSIEAGLAALGYGSFDASQGAFTPASVSQGSAASVPMQKAGAAPRTGAGSPSPTNAAIAVSTAVPPNASPASQDIASGSPTTSSGPTSIEAELAALGYGPSDASQGAPAVPQGSPLQGAGASGQAQNAVAPTTEAALSSRTKPTLAALTPAPASSTDMSAGQNAAASNPTTASEPPSIGAGLSAPGNSAGEASPSRGSGASGQTQEPVATSQRQVASTWRTDPTLVSSSDTSAGENAATSDPTTASDPPSIAAGLSAPGNSAAETSPSQGSGASGQTQEPVAAPQRQVASTWRTNPTLASSSDTSAGENAATSDPTTASDPPSIAAGLSAPGYGAAETSPSQGSGASGQTQGSVAAPQRHVASTWRTNPTLASSSDTSAGQNAVTSDPKTASEPPSIGAGLSAPGNSAAETSPSQGYGASGQAEERVAAPQRQVASTWRTRSTSSALSSGSVSRGAAASGQTQNGSVTPQGVANSSSRTRPELAALGSGASDPAQGAPASGSVSQGLVSQVQVPQGLVTDGMVFQAQVQGSISQDATRPDSVSQLSISRDVGAGDTTQKGAAVPQNPIGAMFQTDPKLAALSGVTDAVSNAAAANPLTADPSLGLQSLQSRTHLAMTNALPVRTSGSERRATASTGAPTISTAATSPTRAATTAQPGDGEPARERAAPAPISPVEEDATGSTAPISPASSLGVAGPGVDPSSSGLASIPLSSLADFVADQASSLTSPRPTSAPTPITPAPQAVKELEISLDPANLGALSVKMRLANGKLSIVIGVSSSSTLSAIESERDAITARLGSTQQPLENLVIMSREPSNESSQDFAQTASGGNDASDPGNPRQARSNDGSSGASRGDGGFTRGRNDPSAASGSTEPASGGGSGDLLV